MPKYFKLIHQCEQLEYINKGTRKYHVYYRKCHPMKQTTNKHINKGTKRHEYTNIREQLETTSGT